MKIYDLVLCGIMAMALLSGCVTKIDYVETSFTGKVDITSIEETKWFLDNYSAYKPQKQDYLAIKNHAFDGEILFFGSAWDPETKVQLPRLLKVTDKAKTADNAIQVFFLNKSLESVSGEEKTFNVKKIPTIIFLKDGKELSRIEEFSEVMEKDLLRAMPKGIEEKR
jgi:hypothetical protein